MKVRMLADHTLTSTTPLTRAECDNFRHSHPGKQYCSQALASPGRETDHESVTNKSDIIWDEGRSDSHLMAHDEEPCLYRAA